jgi:hypothetical protein
VRDEKCMRGFDGGKRLLGRPRRTREDNIKMDLKTEIEWKGGGLDLSGLRILTGGGL